MPGTCYHCQSRAKQQFVYWQCLWTFSIYLEAVAILPQLIVLQRYREVENLTGHYIFFLGAYRALYILNWVSDLSSFNRWADSCQYPLDGDRC